MSSDSDSELNTTLSDISNITSVAPGVRRGSLRGSYNKCDPSSKRRIIECAEAHGNWKLVAEANGVKIQTARRWIHMSADELQVGPRGGAHNTKITDHHVTHMLQMLETNPQVTLAEIRTSVERQFGLKVNISTIHRHLKDQLFTVKKVSFVPSTANTDENKEKRATFVQRIMELTGAQKEILYQDETNVNLFCRRSYGRARRGQPCRVTVPTSRGPNVHCWGLLSKQGIVYSRVCRGSIKRERYREIMSSALQELLNTRESLQNVVIVIDNAPSHSCIEEIAQEERFNGLTILRMSPYSAPLNPIEYLWSALKSKVKSEMARKLSEILDSSTNADLTQSEHRLRIVEDAIRRSLSESDIPGHCESYYNHVCSFYGNVMRMQDLEYGV